MNQPLSHQSDPLLFRPIFAQSIQYYIANLKNLILLASISYLPFFLINWFSTVDLSDPMEILHGFLLDILVCLALPTIVNQNKIYPLETLKIFQDYFAQAIVIVLGQLFLLFFLMMTFSSFGLPFLLLAILPFVFVLFTGQFALVSGKSKIMELSANLQESFYLVKGQFRFVFFSYINISILIVLPILFFSVIYITSHESMGQIQQLSDQTQVSGEELQGMIAQLKKIVNEEGYKNGRLVVHLLFRPLKSVFMALLFACLLQRFTPERYNRFFGMLDPAASPETSSDHELNHKD